MLKSLLATTMVVVLTGCSTLASEGYTAKVNDVEVNTARTEQPSYLVPAIVSAVIIGAVVASSSGGSKSNLTTSQSATPTTPAAPRVYDYQPCIANGTELSRCENPSILDW